MPHSDLVQSVSRSIDILELLAGSEEGMTLQGISGSLGVQPPTAHNLLRTLLARGFVSKSTRPVRYRLGDRLLEIAGIQGSRQMLEQAEQQMRVLLAQCAPATVTLAEATGGQIAISLRLSRERPRILERPRGRVLHPYGSASALLFQAFWCLEERAAFRDQHPFREMGAHLWETPDHLDAYLDEVRRLGVAVPPWTREDALLAMAAPVWGAHHELAAALGASTPTRELNPTGRAALLDGLVAGARSLSAGSMEI